MKAYSIADAARLTGRGRSTLYEMIARGELAAKKMGSRTVVLEADLNAYLQGLPDAVISGSIRATPKSAVRGSVRAPDRRRR